MKVTASLLLLWLTTVDGRAQQPLADLTATPNRPTVTNTAEITQFGVLEIEFGISCAAGQQSLQGLLKFGLLRDVELDWAGNPWQHDASVHYVGVSDNYPGFRWRFLHQAKRQPTLTVEYSVKFPRPGRSKAPARWITVSLCSPARMFQSASMSMPTLATRGSDGREEASTTTGFPPARSLIHRPTSGNLIWNSRARPVRTPPRPRSRRTCGR
jgi:hypothetical protein